MATLAPKQVDVGIAEFVHVLNIATEGYRYMEEIGQHRLHNFLVGDTILLLGWATLFEIGNRPDGGHRAERGIVLVILATLSALLSFLWTILGLRERKFLELQMHLVCNLEKILVGRSGDATLKGTSLIKRLQEGKPVHLPNSDKTLKLSWAQCRMKSRNLAVYAPFAFGVASLLLIGISVLWSL
jgi:hypothetical protein